MDRVKDKTGGVMDRTTAGILGVFLGGMGAHKFYMGKVGMGFIYLLFCWTFVPAVIGCIEGIRYLMIDDVAFAGKVK